VALGSSLEAAGVRSTTAGGLRIVAVPDYLDPQIESIHRSFLDLRQPWMLAKPEGAEVWVGPIMVPGRTACWRCLESRLLEHRWLQSQMTPFLDHRSPKAYTSTYRLRVAAEYVAQEACRWLLEAPGTLEDAIWSFSWETLEARRHAVVRRPQCADCGSPRIIAPARIALGVGTADVTLRARDASATLQMLEPLASPITGILRRFESVNLDLPRGMHAWGGIYCPNVPPSSRRMGGVLIEPAVCGGIGSSREEAQAACLAEAVERYSLQFCGQEPYVDGSLVALGPSAIHPNDVLLLRDSQFNEEEPVEWFEGWSLTQNRARFLPLALTVLDYCVPQKWSTPEANSTGCAAGSTIEEAIVHGILELIERDAVSIWWYNQVELAEVDPTGLEGEAAAIHAHLRSAGWSVRLHDITTDLAIPVAAAVAVNADGGWLLTSAAEVNGQSAIAGALREALLLCRARLRNGPQPPFIPGASISMTPGITAASFQLANLIELLCARLASAGHEVAVFDLTRPDIAFPVVRVVSPGLRDKARRLGPGRLYDVPVRMGWLRKSRIESEMAQAL
jgi:ribosomal protein S12 methylthiotransferase accessory factor